MSSHFSSIPEQPELILYAQHGWADTQRRIAALATQLAPLNTKIVAPNLGFIRTWFWIDPLIQQVEAMAAANWQQYPSVPVRIIGHSMGGLIWLEVLHRHPEWWAQVESIVLVASPVGGSDLGRLIDPWGWGLGIARDLSTNRRGIAVAIAAHIPTLVIAGNTDGGSDGTVIVGATQFRHAQFVELPGISHPALKDHPQVAAAILEFWAQDQAPQPVPSSFEAPLIQRLQAVTGITDAHPRDLTKAKPWLQFENGMTLRTWTNIWGARHVFLASRSSECLYGGFVGWQHIAQLRQVLQAIARDYA